MHEFYFIIHGDWYATALMSTDPIVLAYATDDARQVGTPETGPLILMSHHVAYDPAAMTHEYVLNG